MSDILKKQKQMELITKAILKQSLAKFEEFWAKFASREFLEKLDPQTKEAAKAIFTAGFTEGMEYFPLPTEVKE